MRNTMTLVVGAVLLASAPASAAPKLSPEAKLAKAVEGRVAGESVDCINLRNIRSSQIIDGTAIVYDAGHTVYVNRPRDGADSLNHWNTLVTKTHSSRLCSIDVVQLYDTSARMLTGLVFLDEFVPYRKGDSSR